MKTSPRTPTRQLALALALAWASMASHAADLATTSASLSNLRYRLIDLAPNDGIAPSVTFTGTLLGQAITSLPPGQDGRDFYSAIPNPDDTSRSISAPVMGASGSLQIQSTLPGAQAGLGGTLTAQSSLTADAIGQNIAKTTSSYSYTYQDVDPSLGDGVLRNTTRTETYTYYSIQANNTASVITPAGDAASNITLSPHTLLVVEGTAAVATQFDAQNYDATLAGLQLPSLADRPGSKPSLNAEVSVSLLDSSGSISALPGGSTLEANQGSSALLYGGIGQYTLATSSSDQQNFTLTLANIKDVETLANLNLSVSAISAVSAYWNTNSLAIVYGDPVGGTIDPTPSIPEPSTYALMGLGLVGISWVARRRQANA